MSLSPFKPSLLAILSLVLSSVWVSFASAQVQESSVAQVQAMYVAYYGRPGDSGGINYWAGRLDSGLAIEDLIEEFGNSSEYNERFASLDSNALVNNIFEQVLGREADSAGLAFYAEGLDSGKFTLASIALNVVNGIEEGSGDADTFSNKLTVADAFTEAVDEAAVSYDSSVIDDAVALMSTVDASSAALSDALTLLDDLIAELATPNESALVISSAAFKDTGSSLFNLPLSYTCDGVGGGTSPLLSWTGVADSTVSLVLTMHTVGEGESTPHLTLFNIAATSTSLPAGDLSIGTVAVGDGESYVAPCASGAGTESEIVFTLYELTDTLSLSASARQAEVVSAANDVLYASQSLSARRVRYDAAALAANSHVPDSVPSSCEVKTAHFNEYSSVHAAITCDEDNNQMNIVSHIADGLKTELADQQIQVGVTSWIGRLSLPSQGGGHTRIEPAFLSAASDNLSCEGTGGLGVSIDGQVILEYYKQSDLGGNNCGPNDGEDYANRDTVVLGEVDQCYGHSPNGEGYHLHGAPICLMDVHDPSKPIAYMYDGLPLYFGQGGGTIENTLHAQGASQVTDTNFGAGLYEHLDYRPADVIDGSNPLNDCNAYDLNGDGATSGYVYYTTKEAPYTIGCFMGEVLASPEQVQVENTRLVSERQGWEGQILGDATDVSVTANYYGEFDGKTYNITEVLVNGTAPSFLDSGVVGQVLWRALDASDDNYTQETTCFEFRYRKNKVVTTADETETVCAERAVPDETMDFTPFGSGGS